MQQFDIWQLKFAVEQKNVIVSGMAGFENDPSVPVLSEGDRFEDCKDWVWEVERQKGLVISLELKLEEKDRKLASLEMKLEEKDRKLDKLRHELEGYDSKYWKIREEKCKLNEDYRRLKDVYEVTKRENDRFQAERRKEREQTKKKEAVEEEEGSSGGRRKEN